MATYYVRSGGSDGNTGLGAGTGQAWATIGKALGATGITGGDTVYIAPGTYREVVTIGGTYASNTFIYGDPTASLFSGVTAGEVRITPSGSDNTVSTSFALTATSKDNLNFRDLIIGGMNITTSSNMTIERCLLFSTSATTQAFLFANNNYGNYNTTIKQSIVTGTVAGIEYQYLNNSVAYTAGLYISDCFITGLNAVYFNNNGVFQLFPAGSMVIYNSVLMGYIPWNMTSNYATGTSTGNNIKIYNCVVYATGTYAFRVGQNSGVDENFNRVYGVNTRQNVSQGANTTVASWSGLEFGQSLLQGYGPIQIFGNTFNSPNATAGTASGAPLVDMYNQSWNVTPDIGVAIYRNIGGVGQYLPAERNASAITIAPGSTSQSIELYLGATGLTFATTGLAAYYVRNQSAPVAITLVTQTATGAWSSGGFAEISSSLVPGVYRLDVPNAAFAAGASDVTIVVRGASGTNGAVLTVTLSSGGLTAAQTAAAVWDEPYTSHTTASTFGARTLKTTVDNRLVDVGTSNHIQSNVHAIVDSTAAASELSGALLHNGTDYISADLLTPVSAATSVHIGPYQLLADGLGADQPLDINVGTATSIDVQVTDANGTGIDITGATVTAKVYSSAGTLVATYSGTATYADNGRLSFGLTTTVTNTSGTYTVLVTRTTGATDTQIFGPLRLYVRPV
jgi:hypothetical protein